MDKNQGLSHIQFLASADLEKKAGDFSARKIDPPPVVARCVG